MKYIYILQTINFHLILHKLLLNILIVFSRSLEANIKNGYLNEFLLPDLNQAFHLHLLQK